MVNSIDKGKRGEYLSQQKKDRDIRPGKGNCREKKTSAAKTQNAVANRGKGQEGVL